MNKLKKYLRINSAFSLASGTVMLLFTNELNSFFGINHPYVFPVIGMNLVVFAIFVGFVSTRQLKNRVLVNLISGLDGLWVLGSLTIVLFGLFDLSLKRMVLISGVALWIGFLGYKQYVNNRSQEGD